jgi:hypothetical protein
MPEGLFLRKTLHGLAIAIPLGVVRYLYISCARLWGGRVMHV